MRSIRYSLGLKADEKTNFYLKLSRSIFFFFLPVFMMACATSQTHNNATGINGAIKNLKPSAGKALIYIIRPKTVTIVAEKPSSVNRAEGEIPSIEIYYERSEPGNSDDMDYAMMDESLLGNIVIDMGKHKGKKEVTKDSLRLGTETTNSTANNVVMENREIENEESADAKDPLEVSIDERPIGYTSPGSFLVTEVLPGMRTVSSSWGELKSFNYENDFEQGKTYYLIQKARKFNSFTGYILELVDEKSGRNFLESSSLGQITFHYQ